MKIVILIALLSTLVLAQTAKPRYKENPLYDRALEFYDMYKTRQANIVMLGNSGVHGVNWQELLGRTDVVERGIVSDILEGYLARMNYIYKLNPKVVFIIVGVNDIYNWIPVDDIFSNYVKIIEGLRARGIIPVIQLTVYTGKDWGKDSGLKQSDNAGRNQEIAKLNVKLSEYAKNNKIVYIDLNKKLTINNFLRTEFTHDSGHFNAKGYRIWGNEVETVLKTIGI